MHYKTQELSDAVRMRKMEVIAHATKSACDAGVHEPWSVALLLETNPQRNVM